MALDFPNSPAVNDIFSSGTRRWQWNGTAWLLIGNHFTPMTVSDTAPSSPAVGDEWLNTNTGSMYVFYDGYWIEEGLGYAALNTPNTVRNKAINGDMSVWQRGGGAFTTNAVATADQYKVFTVGDTFSVTREAFAFGNVIPGYEPKYYLRNAVTSVAGAGNVCTIQNRIEDVRTLAGQTATLSFWAKVTSGTRTIGIDYEQNFGTGGSPSSAVNFGSQAFSLTTSWQRFTATVTLPSISGKTLGSNNNDFLAIVFWLDAGSNWNSRSSSIGQASATIDLWGVQLEAGSFATPFDVTSYADQLARCQRYYYRITPAGSVYGPGYCISTTGGRWTTTLPVEMRTIPTLETTGSAADYGVLSATGTGVACSAVPTISALGTRVVPYGTFAVASGTVAGDGTFLYDRGSSGYLAFSAEL